MHKRNDRLRDILFPVDIIECPYFWYKIVPAVFLKPCRNFLRYLECKKNLHIVPFLFFKYLKNYELFLHKNNFSLVYQTRWK